MDTIRGVLESQALGPLIVNGLVVLTGAVVAIVSFAFLIPLDSVPAATGVTIIMAVSYALSIIAWVVVMFYYSGENGKQLIWLLAHMMFLVILPATIAATAMNVTAIQNTRNLIAGKISA